MTLAHPDRFLVPSATPALSRVCVLRPNQGRRNPPEEDLRNALSMAAWAREAEGRSVYWVDAQDARLSLAGATERCLQAQPDAVVVAAGVMHPEKLRWQLESLHQALPNSLLIVAKEQGLAGLPAEDLGHYHFLLCGDTQAGLAQLLDLAIRRDPQAARSLSGLTWRDQEGNLQHNPAWHADSALPEGPVPAWDLLGQTGQTRFPVRTSKVCPPDCPTCHGAFGRTLRRRKPESVLAECQTLVQEFGATGITIMDEVFDFEPEHCQAILEGLAQMPQPLELRFANGLRGDRIEPAMAQLLRRAGLKSVHLPIGSASPRIQQMLGKNLDMPGLELGIQNLASEGIRVRGHFAFGYDREDPRERERSIEFARRSSLHSVRFEPVGKARHGNRWSDRLAAGARFYAGRERHAAWKSWFEDRGESTWQPAAQHGFEAAQQWIAEVGCRLRLRQRQ